MVNPAYILRVWVWKLGPGVEDWVIEVIGATPWESLGATKLVSMTFRSKDFGRAMAAATAFVAFNRLARVAESVRASSLPPRFIERV